MRGSGAEWSWLGDPCPGDPRAVARALSTEKRLRFMYRTTIWTLIRDVAQASDGSSEPGLSLRLRFDADGVVVGAWILTPVWLVRRARLKRRVEAIQVSVADPSEEASGVERLLSEAAAVIDLAVS